MVFSGESKPQLENLFFEKKAEIDVVGLDLVKKLLCLNPANRITIEEALTHPFFTTEPLPCLQSEMPKIQQDLHEFKVRQQIDLKRKKTLELKKAQEISQNSQIHKNGHQLYQNQYGASGYYNSFSGIQHGQYMPKINQPQIRYPGSLINSYLPSQSVTSVAQNIPNFRTSNPSFGSNQSGLDKLSNFLNN